MEERIFYSRKEAAAFFGVGLTSFDKLTKLPDFPRPIRIHTQVVKFYRPALEAWAERKAAEAATCEAVI